MCTKRSYSTLSPAPLRRLFVIRVRSCAEMIVQRLTLHPSCEANRRGFSLVKGARLAWRLRRCRAPSIVARFSLAPLLAPPRAHAILSVPVWRRWLRCGAGDKRRADAAPAHWLGQRQARSTKSPSGIGQLPRSTRWRAARRRGSRARCEIVWWPCGACHVGRSSPISQLISPRSLAMRTKGDVMPASRCLSRAACAGRYS